MAVTGPFFRAVNIPGLSESWRWWYRRKPIEDKPLAYQFSQKVRRRWTGEEDSASYTGWAVTPLDDGTVSSLKDQIYQKAYGRLMNEVSAGSAQLGADFGERKQSITALTARVKQLTTAATALKHGRILDFFKALGIKKRSWRTKASDMGGLWLEYSYGWKPLVQDIYTAVNVVQRPAPKLKVKGRASGTLSTQVTNTVSTHTDVTLYKWQIRCQLQMRIAVSNWWAWQANELGLTNPASIAWELVPFSFVVDWFLPIGNYLQSLTDFVGLSQEDPSTMWFGQVDRDFKYTDWLYPLRDSWRLDRWVNMRRSLTFGGPPKLMPRFTGFYSARGANAIALLSSTLRDLPKIPVPGRRFKMSRDMYNWDRNPF